MLMQVRSFTRELPAETRPGLLLIGEPGTSKTHLACGGHEGAARQGPRMSIFRLPEFT